MMHYLEFIGQQQANPQKTTGSPHTLYNCPIAFAREYGVDITQSKQGQTNKPPKLEGWRKPMSL